MSRPIRPSITMWRYPGLAAYRNALGPRDAMSTFVSHNDIGLNFLERGEMRVLLASGYRYELTAGRLAVYWGAVPHRVESYTPRSILHWVALPLGNFLRYTMPPSFTRQLIEGRVFFEAKESEAPLDLAMLRRWEQVILSEDAEERAIMLLELEARLRRLAHSSPVPRRLARIVPSGPSSQAERMLLLIAAHFRERLTGSDVAMAVGLHRGYASGLFHRHVGMGLNEYITQCRISHAKALLATTEAKILDVALDSGFGSVSQFHAIFKRLCDSSPRAYRMSLRSTASSRSSAVAR